MADPKTDDVVAAILASGMNAQQDNAGLSAAVARFLQAGEELRQQRAAQQQPASEEPRPKPSATAEARADFIKRLFAVTLSVGVASQLSRIIFDANTIQNHHFFVAPVLARWREILLLFTSLLIVVNSWEGYLNAIQRLPLEDLGRFWIDILLVFTYLLLTLSNEAFDFWFFIHVVVFVFYLIWDFMRSRLPDYIARQRAHPQLSYEISMNITAVWLVYFIILFAIKYYVNYFDGALGFLAISMAALLGVIFYRWDKANRATWTWRRKLLATALPLVVLSMIAFFHIGPNC